MLKWPNDVLSQVPFHWANFVSGSERGRRCPAPEAQQDKGFDLTGRDSVPCVTATHAMFRFSTLFKRHGETGNHGVSCFHHLRPIGPPRNPMECEIIRSFEGDAPARSHPPERPGARRSAAWTGRAGWGRVAPQGRPGAQALERAVRWAVLEGEIANGIAHVQRCVTYLGCAHVAHETTRDVVG